MFLQWEKSTRTPVPFLNVPLSFSFTYTTAHNDRTLLRLGCGGLLCGVRFSVDQGRQENQIKQLVSISPGQIILQTIGL